MSLDIGSHPIYDTILRSLGTDPDNTRKYNPGVADISYIIGFVSKAMGTTDITAPRGVSDLIQEGLVMTLEDDGTYYGLTKVGKEIVKSRLNQQ